MGRLVILIFACSTMFFLAARLGEGVDIGVNWGRGSTQKLLPSMVVDMLLANGVRKVKLQSFNVGVVQAFTASKIEIMMTIPNVEAGMVNETERAKLWVKENVTRAYYQYDINVKYLMVGNEPYTIVDNYTKIQQSYFDKALCYLTKHIKSQIPPYNGIKVSIPHAPDVLIPNITKPSEADFNDVVKERMLNILGNLSVSGSPFAVNIYPHLSILEKNFPLDFAFFDNVSDFKIIDGDNVYTNVFDFVYDSFVCALKRYGHGKLNIVVTQIGWPTDGHIYANISTALRFYDGFLKKMDKNEGTPLRPGPIEAYILNLNDENSKDMTYRGPTERHYGLYNYRGQPKFHVDLSLKGRKDVKLTPAEGVILMPRRWCVYSNETVKSNLTARMVDQFNYACSKSDCSKLHHGGSLNNLTFEGNVSYAFNSYFQVRNQKEFECDFKGLGKIQAEDPSEIFGCDFPLQIISTIFVWGKGEMGATLAARGVNAAIVNNNNGLEGRLGIASGLVVIAPLLCFFIFLSLL